MDQKKHPSSIGSNQLIELPNVSVFTPDIPTLNGQVEVIKDGIPLYFDDDHLSTEGTLFLLPKLERAIQQVLQAN